MIKYFAISLLLISVIFISGCTSPVGERNLTPNECLDFGGRTVNIVGGDTCYDNETKIGNVIGFISPNVCCLVIDSFEDCVNAGFPIMESYPRQCSTLDGRKFTEEINLCNSDEECVAATCCHPDQCTHINNAPDCSSGVCTLQCEPESMDCGHGHCACVDNICQVVWDTCNGMTFEDAKQIALDSECVENGTLKDTYFCNENTDTWWIDLDIEKKGCSPACVINTVTREAEINWRCTGLL